MVVSLQTEPGEVATVEDAELARQVFVTKVMANPVIASVVAAVPGMSEPVASDPELEYTHVIGPWRPRRNEDEQPLGLLIQRCSAPPVLTSSGRLVYDASLVRRVPILSVSRQLTPDCFAAIDAIQPRAFFRSATVLLDQATPEQRALASLLFVWEYRELAAATGQPYFDVGPSGAGFGAGLRPPWLSPA